jgi:PST family polysaccharide transporter
MLRFGLRIVYDNVVTFAAQNIDYFLISRFSGPASLGVYSMAFRLSRFPLERITSILYNVLWPAFSSIQSDHDRLKRNYLNVTTLVPFVAFPALSLLAIYIEDIVLLVIGPQWAAVGNLLLIFMPYLILMSCCFSDSSMLILKNRLSQVYRARTVALLCTGALGVPAILRFDMAGMAGVYAAVTSLYLLYIKVQAAQAVGVTVREAASHFGALGAYLLVCIGIPLAVSVLPGGFWLHLLTSMVTLILFCMLAYRCWFSGRADPRHF